jgi:hypothetical protein
MIVRGVKKIQYMVKNQQDNYLKCLIIFALLWRGTV